MSGADTDECIGTMQGVRRVVEEQGLRERLKSDDGPAVAAKLGFPPSAYAELLQLVSQLEASSGAGFNGRGGAALTSARRAESAETAAASDSAVHDYLQTQLEVFGQIRQTYRVALWMSLVVFVVGVVLLGIAVARATTESQVSGGTLALAGMGLADFAILFFRQPWKDVAVNLMNAQRTRTIATTYLVGLSFLRDGDEERLKLLDGLTTSCVGALDRIAATHSDR
ncbi:MAG TPA: hypothetical protein VGX50_19800 [Longimicrobium sp.]|jgi:F0F1-type ATP synthase assembly protein I|nr:hypothetical protein [Longimicrobium sp.]